MQKSLRSIFILSLACLCYLTGCNSPDAPDCLKSAGSNQREIRSIHDSIQGIALFQEINLHLVPDTTSYLEVEAPKNLLPKIRTERQGQNLHISNENTCNWVRQYGKAITVHYHFRVPPSKITQKGFGQITAEDTLVCDSAFRLYLEGQSNVNLPIRSPNFFLECKLLADVKLQGKVGYGLFLVKDRCRVQARQMEINYARVIHQSERDVHLSVRDYMEAIIDLTGNLYYWGEPGTEIAYNSSGKVIQKP